MAATSKSAALTREILEKLASLKDPDLEARNDATPDRVPFTKRACAERLRTFAAHRWLPSSEGGAQPEALARRGFRCAGRADGDAPVLVGEELTPPVDASVWVDDDASARERTAALLDGLDAFAARGPDAAAAAEALGAAGWDVVDGTTVSCAFCARAPRILEVGAPAVHRVWCPRAGRDGGGDPLRDAAAELAKAGPPAKRARVSD